VKTCSVNMIVRDVEGEIGQCLDSIISAGCFSEIVIAVDTRTRDRTLQVIDSYRSLSSVARRNVIPIKAFWYDHHGVWDELGARNAALRESGGEYILWIDADEILDNLPEGFCNLLQNSSLLGETRAFYLHQVSILSDGTYYDLPQIRLFPNIRGVRWELPIHCQIFFSLERLGIPMEDTPYRILHTGYDSPEKIRDKHVRNYPMLLGYLNEHRTNNRKRQYIMDRYNESYNYLKSNGLLNLGFLDPVTIGTIVSIAVTLIMAGLAKHDAISQAKQQAGIQRYFQQQEMAQLASALHSRFPTVSMEDWMLAIQLEESMPQQQPLPTPEPEPSQNYLPYIVAGIILLAVMLR